MSSSRSRLRWGALAALFVVAWLASGGGTPMYDGIGAPDEPYRHVPPQSGAATPAATTAKGRLTTAGGLTILGKNVNSAEAGPQVSLFIPPYSLAVRAATSRPTVVDVVAAPVAPRGSAAPGTAVSNVYEVRFTSPGGAVTVESAAQPLGISMRSVDALRPTPVMRHRPDESSPWTSLQTKRLGFDIYHADLPGAGFYVLTRDAAAPGAVKPAANSSKSWLIVVGLVLLAPLLGVVRLLTRGSRQQL